MKNFLRMGLFAVVAGSVLSLLPMSVSALQPPQLIVVEGLEGYKLLVQLAGTDNSRDYTDILIYMTNNNLIHGDMHLVSSSSLARDFAHVRRFVEGIEALKIPVRRGANLDDVFFDFHFGDNVDGRVASWRTTVLIDNAVISFMVMEREYIEGTVIATRQPNAWGTWLHPHESSLIQDNQYQRSSYLISQGNLRIRVSLFVLGDADFYAMEDLLELFDFITIDEVLYKYTQSVSVHEHSEMLAAVSETPMMLSTGIPYEFLGEVNFLEYRTAQRFFWERPASYNPNSVNSAIEAAEIAQFHLAPDLKNNPYLVDWLLEHERVVSVSFCSQANVWFVKWNFGAESGTRMFRMSPTHMFAIDRHTGAIVEYFDANASIFLTDCSLREDGWQRTIGAEVCSCPEHERKGFFQHIFGNIWRLFLRNF